MTTRTTVRTEYADNVLDKVKETFGFVPNQFVEMTDHNPLVADAYLAVNNRLENGQLSEKEQQAVILAISAYNDCHYCQAAHTVVGREAGLTDEQISIIKNGGDLQDQRLRNLVDATHLVLDKRGWLEQEKLSSLDTRGVTRGEIFEIITLIGLKTMSNYVNHIARTEIDEPSK